MKKKRGRGQVFLSDPIIFCPLAFYIWEDVVDRFYQPFSLFFVFFFNFLLRQTTPYIPFNTPRQVLSAFLFRTRNRYSVVELN